MQNNMLATAVDQALESLRSHFIKDGGNIEVANVSEDNIVTLKWLGNCATCERSGFTFEYSVKEFLIKEFPQIKEIIEI